MSATAALRRAWPLVLLLVAAGPLLFKTPYQASDFDVPPDENEYALTAHQLVDSGRFEIRVGGRWLPPWPPPWFSASVIAPAYLVDAGEVGNAIVPIFVLALAGVAFAYALGAALSGPWGGSLAGLALLALASYRTWSRQVMTDVPSTALILALAWLHLRLRRAASPRIRAFAGAGLLIALGALWRPMLAAALLPFLLDVRGTPPRAALARLAALALPLAAALALSLAYNARVFGSPWRNGFQFWCAVPYDYPALTFSLAYVTTNLRFLAGTAFLWLLAAALALGALHRVLARRSSLPAIDRGAARALAEFGLLATGPIVLFHLVYFYADHRFFLPALAVLAALAGGLSGGVVRRAPHFVLPLVLAAAATFAALYRARHPDAPPERRLAAERLREHTPADAVIVTALEPGYSEYLVALGSERTIVPISRHVEYADKLLAPTRVDDPDPPPASWADHRCLGLVRAGAREAVRDVASESLGLLERELARGRRLFLDTTFVAPVDEETVHELRRKFAFVQRAKFLFELRPR